MRRALRSTEGRLKQVNEQIHYTVQYLANKSVYRQFVSSRNKNKILRTHGFSFALVHTSVLCFILQLFDSLTVHIMRGIGDKPQNGLSRSVRYLSMYNTSFINPLSDSYCSTYPLLPTREKICWADALPAVSRLCPPCSPFSFVLDKPGYFLITELTRHLHRHTICLHKWVLRHHVLRCKKYEIIIEIFSSILWLFHSR